MKKIMEFKILYLMFYENYDIYVKTNLKFHLRS